MYVYIVKCNDGSLYTGWTTDPLRRLIEHNSGVGAKYTRSRRPVELVYLDKFETKSDAMKEEARIKKLSRDDKLDLILKSNYKFNLI